ncbi:MAG: YfhO family protein [Acidobacteriota bacterium]
MKRTLEPQARWITAATLFVLPFFYFLPATVGRVALTMGDSWSYSILMRMLAARLWANGELPLWNPYTFGGMPLLAAIQPGVLYPPNWLFLILPPGVALNLVVITTYSLCLLGVYLYARAVRFQRASALLSAICFTFGGFLISHLEQVNYIASAVWLPWILLAIEKIYQETNNIVAWRWIALGAVFIALQVFAGLPQATFQTALICGPYVLFSVFGRGRSNWRLRCRFLFFAVLLAVTGALLAAVQLLPARELQTQGERAAIPYESFALFSMPLRRLFAFVMPYFFGGAVTGLYQVGGWDHWWLHKYVHGYFGLLPLLLLPIAWVGIKQNTLVKFWTGVMLTGLCLSLGDNLPFGLNHLLYRIPVFNLFRAPYRHLYEASFAAAMLAGYGLQTLGELEAAKLRRILFWASTALTGLVMATLLTYRFFADRLSSLNPPPPSGNSLLNAEALIPILFFALSLAAIWFYGMRRSAPAGVLVILVVILDLSFFGWFTYWRTTGYEVLRELSDPPAIQAIKEREPSLTEFRVISYAANPYDRNYAAMNHANLTIVRGLQSASGYDPMRLPRPAELAGKMDIFGVISEREVFGKGNVGLDLLNVKYLLREHKSLSGNNDDSVITISGIRFDASPLNLTLKQGGHAELYGGTFASEIIFVTTMANSGAIPDDAVIGRIKIHAKDGRLFEREIIAGRDTSEWAYDRSDVKANIRHRRANIAESWQEAGFEGHRYLARFNFERVQVERIELEYAQAEGELLILRASLHDAQAGVFQQVEATVLPENRWRKLNTFGEVELYENLQVLPRAWLANRVEVLPNEMVLRAIKTGRLPNGETFDPRVTALLEQEDHQAESSGWPTAKTSAEERVEFKRYESHRLTLQSQSYQPRLLVLSEVYYRGWDAWIDGDQQPVKRVNYTLRGLLVPPGIHEIEFRYTAPSFWKGARYSLLGLFILLSGIIITQVSEKRRAQTAAQLSLSKANAD